MKPVMADYALAHAASADVANRQMRAAGRKVWNEDDYALAAETFNKLYPPKEGETNG